MTSIYVNYLCYLAKKFIQLILSAVLSTQFGYLQSYCTHLQHFFDVQYTAGVTTWFILQLLLICLSPQLSPPYFMSIYSYHFVLTAGSGSSWPWPGLAWPDNTNHAEDVACNQPASPPSNISTGNAAVHPTTTKQKKQRTKQSKSHKQTSRQTS